MLFSLLAAFFPALIVAIGFVAVVTVASRWRSGKQSLARRSPLTRDLLRPPGHSLRTNLASLDLDIDLHVLALLGVPLLMYTIHISQSYLGRTPEDWLRISVSILVVVLVEIWTGQRLLRLLHERKIVAVGLDGELATAEELNQLMLDGCRVFHDVPIQYGNVDHVVVSQSGVYAVNTKALGKLPSTGSNAEVVVDHTRNVVQFPDREYPIPVDRLIMEARCLARHLTSAVGKQIEAEPMIALPGWCIKERTGRGPVYIINPRNPQKFFIQNRRVLSPELVQQVAHQLEQLCRDVEPLFQDKKGWGTQGR